MNHYKQRQTWSTRFQRDNPDHLDENIYCNINFTLLVKSKRTLNTFSNMIRNSSGIGAEIKLVLDVYIHSKIIMAFDTSDQDIFGTCTLSEYRRTTTTHSL